MRVAKDAIFGRKEAFSLVNAFLVVMVMHPTFSKFCLSFDCQLQTFLG